MQFEISKNMDRKIEEASKEMGIDKEEVINRAISLFLEDVRKMKDLEKEMKTWDKLHVEALSNFERELWNDEKSG